MLKRCKNLIIALLFQSLICQPVHASDDSCVQGISLLNTLVANITTLGLFTVYSASFYMKGAPSGNYCDANFYQGSTHNPKSCAPNAANCSSDCDSRGGMTICYKTITYTGVTASNPTGLSYDFECNEVRDGWSKTYTFPPATIRAQKVGDQLCAQFWTIIGYQSIGCKYLPDCSQFGLTSSCFVAKSCSESAFQYSRSLISISGGIIQCIQDSIKNLFQASEGCTVMGQGGTVGGSYTPNYFPMFQDTVRNIVAILLVLYVILFGIKVTLGGEVPSKGEFFTMGAKFLLVLYFSVGIPMGYDNQKRLEYDDGVTTIMQPLFQNASTTLTSIVYSAGGASGLCKYNLQDYPKDYQYLALWDSIDCRILYYLGFNANQIQGQGVAAIAYVGIMYFPLVPLILAAFFGFQVIFAIFSLVFMVFLLSVAVYLVNITVVSIIALGILTYLAPIFVPMALFEYTKRYFEGWLKLMISYALQPMVVAAFVAMMLTIFDQTMYGNCTFVSSNVNWSDDSSTYVVGSPTKAKPVFNICDPDSPQPGCSTSVQDPNALPCKETFGYQIATQAKDALTSTSAVFFTYNSMKSGRALAWLPGLITLCLFAYLFYQFSEMLGEFTAELTGGTNLGAIAGRPMATFDAIASLVAKGAGGKASPAASGSGSMASMSGAGGVGSGSSVGRTGAG